MIRSIYFFNLCAFLILGLFVILIGLPLVTNPKSRLSYLISENQVDTKKQVHATPQINEESDVSPEQFKDDNDSVTTFTEQQLKEYNKNFPDKYFEQHDEDVDVFKFKTEGEQDRVEEKRWHKKALSKCKYCNKFPNNQTEIDMKKMYVIPNMCHGRIDAVWIWVNGSDPKWRNDLSRYEDKIDFNRYRDSRVLKYSMRSVSKYLPYIKHYFLVTADQVPDFIESPGNLTHFRIIKNEITLEVIPHKDLINNTILPTFNSEAIETYLFKIPNLSECFVFLGDDFFFYRPTPPDYYFKGEKLVIHTEQKVPADRKPFEKNQYMTCMFYSNKLINTYFGKDPNHKNMIMSHTPHMFRKSILKDVEQAFLNEINKQRNSKMRRWNSTNWGFLFGNYVASKGLGEYSIHDNKCYFFMVRNNHINNVMEKIIVIETEPYTLGVNDEMNDKFFEKEMRYIHRWLETKYINKTVFER
ncbi:capsular polysaccharide phosphotransferase cps12A, putative [Entamoeba invadens IP1]|uniref:Capsular polysaccharide phosphotransferase cps12A, putative n=1 Tax=Entamoeba invadens IP1 TaxID=370355 RepID=A0A0A1UGN1_ENTIV|nr:capsular polysaccharide phosphotransferase cps12A, putative [Entamoeba invadens IP1]ELP92854.1 capsular polysaccharide phosphotransferase cps12A, putative [Entamoeba invadens IP1]|eukprot:XP_004259625.1 capsular polysaccharide phosphotransferase cps12A, putative [Entamoeba invadens IP1]